MRTQAYVDLIKGVAGAAIAQQNNDTQRNIENQALVTDARARIAIYGSKSAVSHLARIIRAGFVLNTPERMKDFLYFCQMIRSETFQTNKALITEIYQNYYIVRTYDSCEILQYSWIC
jgi:hypothetical protein